MIERAIIRGGALARIEAGGVRAVFRADAMPIPGPRGAAGPSGGSAEWIAARALSGHRVLAAINAVHVDYADAADLSLRNRIIGVSAGAASAGAPVMVFNAGMMNFNGWSWVAGAPVFLGAGGALTQVLPASPSAFSIVIGRALAPDTLFVAIGAAIILS